MYSFFDLMHPLLHYDIVKAAYHLALMEQPYSDTARWCGHRNGDGGIDAVAALYDAGSLPVIFLLGDPAAMQFCLAAAELPGKVYAAYFPEHEQYLGEYYNLAKPRQMSRMVLHSSTFNKRAPIECAFNADTLGEDALVEHTLDERAGVERAGVERQSQTAQLVRDCVPVALQLAELPALQQLYLAEPDFNTDVYQFASGRYVGIFDGRELVAAAGTHFLCEKQSFAMIGNVFTHPAHRRNGLARLAAAALLRQLFDKVDTVCLNVRTSNQAAVKLYESLGFTTHCTYLESPAVLHENVLAAV